jgi:hypothetical protein
MTAFLWANLIYDLSARNGDASESNNKNTVPMNRSSQDASPPSQPRLTGTAADLSGSLIYKRDFWWYRVYG